MSRASETLEPQRAGDGAAPHDSSPASGLGPKRPLDELSVIAAVAQQPTRTAAIEHLVRAVAPACGGGVVRMIWGDERRIRRIFDHRLGSLGTESSLWHEITTHWARLATGPQVAIRTGGVCIVRLPEPGGRRRALLWFACGPEQIDVAAALERMAPALASVLWSRPPIAVPRQWRNRRRAGLLAATAVAALLVALLPLRYPIHCTAHVEPVHQRMIAAPFEATLLESLVQPGDPVAAGELLAVLDGRPLRLELEALRADSQQARKQHDAALASGRIADAQLADLENRQLQRRIDLLEERLAGLEIRSPIDGVVVSGDLRKAIGSPLEMGKPLLEIAPLRRMTMEIEIPERDIAYAGVDAPVRVRLDAAATDSIDGQLRILYPAAEVRDDRNVFLGQWELENRDGTFRPGMRGTAVVYGPRRPLIWPLIRRSAEAVLRGIGW